MIDITMLSKNERLSLAKAFLDAHRMGQINRNDFDLWIIDAELADDPGTTDTSSIEHKGFVQQRSLARRNLNKWASELPPEHAYKIEADRSQKDIYRLVPWGDGSYAEAADIGNRVELFSKNKIKHVERMYRQLTQQVADNELDEGPEELMQMVGMLAGYGKVMEKRIIAEVEKFNKAVALVEGEVERLSLAAPADEGTAA